MVASYRHCSKAGQPRTAEADEEVGITPSREATTGNRGPPKGLGRELAVRDGEGWCTGQGHSKRGAR